MGIRKRYKHLKRLKQIVNTLTKHGLGQIVNTLGLIDIQQLWHGTVTIEETDPISYHHRLKQALEELGPAFVKLGQLLSTRSDILGHEFIEQLKQLQDNVSPVEYDTIAQIIQVSLEKNIEELFSYFDPNPLAAASIGQVHYARLLDGREVVVKVQRPGVETMITTDLEIFLDIARLVEARTHWGKFYNIVELAEEFTTSIKEETDYTIEASNAERLYKNFLDDSTVKVPLVHWQYTVPKVLVLEFIKGEKFSVIMEEGHYDLRCTIAGKLAHAIFKQIFIDGFFHADPHPGNLALEDGKTIVFWDFGLMGSLDENLKDSLGVLALAIVNRDVDGIAIALVDIGQARQQVNIKKLKKDIAKFLNRYYDIPLGKISLGTILNEMLLMAYRYKIRVPAEITLLSKTLVMLEGILKNLDPNISILKLAEPFAIHLIRERYEPLKIAKRINQKIKEVSSLGRELPQKLNKILSLIEANQLNVKLDLKNLSNYVNQFQGMTTRISLSIMVAALIISSALFSLQQNKSYILSLPIAEIELLLAIILILLVLLNQFRNKR